MKTTDTQELLNIYSRVRQTGFTTAIVEAAKKHKNSAIICRDFNGAQMVKKLLGVDQVTVTTLSEVGSGYLIGRAPIGPIFMDNAAISHILAEYAATQAALAYANRDVQEMSDKLRLIKSVVNQ